MTELFSYLLKSDAIVHWKSHGLQGTINTRPRITGHLVLFYPVSIKSEWNEIVHTEIEHFETL